MSDTTDDDLNASQFAQDQDEEKRPEEEPPGALNVLSETAQRFLGDPDVDVAANRDLPDDASGEEPPQDGDPAR